MIVIESISELVHWRKSLPSQNTVGFVPTMGALHEGHLKLIRNCQDECDVTVVSIFVNRKQFNQASDFEAYPKNLEVDLNTLKNSLKIQPTVVFAPQESDIFPQSDQFLVTESDLSLILEGKHRPGHFNGMLTIVLKLLNISQPHRLYMGLKDLQQYLLVKNMIESLFLQIKIVGVETERETTGLAMSSRNSRLTREQRVNASILYKSLSETNSPVVAKEILEKSGFEVEYMSELAGRKVAAVWFHGVRLIDNV